MFSWKPPSMVSRTPATDMSLLQWSELMCSKYEVLWWMMLLQMGHSRFPNTGLHITLSRCWVKRVPRTPGSRAMSHCLHHEEAIRGSAMCLVDWWHLAISSTITQSLEIRASFASCSTNWAFPGSLRHCAANDVPNSLSSSWHCSTRLILLTSSEASVRKTRELRLSLVDWRSFTRKVNFLRRMQTPRIYPL